MVEPPYIDTRTIIAQIRSAFTILDTNSDGRIDAEELKRLLRRLSIEISDAIINQLISETSKNGDGSITEEEFFRWMLKMDAHHDDFEGELMAAFRVFDTDNSGTISIDELKSAMELLGEHVTDEELDRWLRAADINNDGSINYDEFIRIIKVIH